MLGQLSPVIRVCDTDTGEPPPPPHVAESYLASQLGKLEVHGVAEGLDFGEGVGRGSAAWLRSCIAQSSVSDGREEGGGRGAEVRRPLEVTNRHREKKVINKTSENMGTHVR